MWLPFFFFNGGYLLCFAGLPIQVRDTGLSVKDDVPKSDVNKEYYTQNMEREVEFLSDVDREPFNFDYKYIIIYIIIW